MDDILASIKVPSDHPLFYPRLFAWVARHAHAQRQKHPPLPYACLSEEYIALSRQLERATIQEGCAVRNVIRTRQLAQLLIDSKGELNVALLPDLIAASRQHLYSLGPEYQYDAPRNRHLLHVLELLHSRPELVRLLKRFSRPLSNKPAEELIRHTLQLKPSIPISDAHTRQAALSAWLCYLRQNVGSCFATAPAIIIHDEQPERFLQDLLDLIAKGMLKRTFGGIEQAVPLSDTWGSGDLKKPLVVRLSPTSASPEIWRSPGLIAAFESTGLLQAELPTAQKMQQLKAWIQAMFRPQSSSTITTSAEEIIRKVLQQKLGVTDRQLQEQASRPKEFWHLSMGTPAWQIAPQDGLSQRVRQFSELFERAKNTFKSLADNALLKAWEFTIASFSDIKYEFARWNFYASLGLSAHETGGIGACIYQTIQNKLDAVNNELAASQGEYEAAYTQVKTLESRLRHASTDKEMQWLKIEHQSRVQAFYFIEEQRQNAQTKANTLVQLYDTLYALYVDLFQDYFQEVYDADLQETVTGRFDDHPAGFRLLYKHGRSHTSQWTRIHDPHEFVEALTAFFTATEPHIAQAMEGKKIEKDLADVVTAIVHHIKTKEFLESALHRMAVAHQAPCVPNPLEHLEQIEKKPWVYTSGGTMHTLVSCYYGLAEKPKEVEKWVESDTELLVYLADTLKALPAASLRPYLKGERQALLMQSPTHAFLLKPMLDPFNETWNNEAFTYTFIRDRFIRPAELFLEGLSLNEGMRQCIIQALAEKIPAHYMPGLQELTRQMRGLSDPIFFRAQINDILAAEQRSPYYRLIEEVDSLLYASLPLFSADELPERVEAVLMQLPMRPNPNRLLSLCRRVCRTEDSSLYLGAAHLQNIVKALICLDELSTTTPYDYHWHVRQAAQKLGLALPAPLIFADSNWVKDMFGFVVNPGTGRLELWRLDYTGSTGYPLSSWREWLNGSRPNRHWGVYTQPFQYGQN